MTLITTLNLKKSFVKKKILSVKKKFLTSEKMGFIYKDNMELNIEKIDLELLRLQKTRHWLATQILTLPEYRKSSRQRIAYWFKVRCLRGADPIGRVLGMDGKELIRS